MAAVTAYVGIGSNLGDSVTTVSTAMTELKAVAGVSGVGCSSLYRSAPVGNIDQPDFVNAVCALQTGIPAEALLQSLLRIECAHGRQRDGTRDAPRTLDLDLLLYGSIRIQQRNLVVPHPRLHQRAFVLYPLLEIAPSLVIPGHGSVAGLCDGCGEQGIVRLGRNQSG